MENLYKSILCSLYLVAALFSGNVYSSELKFVTLEVAPWAYREEGSDNYQGIFPDLVKEIEKRTGHKIKITLAPYVRINRELEAARQDCTMLISDDEREKITIRGALIFNHPMGVVGRKSLSINSYEDLSGIKISLLRGSVISGRFDADENLKKDYDTDYKISLEKIKHGRLDAIAGAIPTIQYLANKSGYGDLLGKPFELAQEPIYLHCSKGSENVKYIDDINDAIEEIKNDSTLDFILNNNA
jgi:polar amino acid transport system substrate-binding protein